MAQTIEDFHTIFALRYSAASDAKFLPPAPGPVSKMIWKRS
jgi:hypothetical protein